MFKLLYREIFGSPKHLPAGPFHDIKFISLMFPLGFELNNPNPFLSSDLDVSGGVQQGIITTK